MRTFAPTIAVLALLAIAPASAQMTDTPAQTPQAQQPSGGVMMCGPATTGQGQATDMFGKPLQTSMMCPCCQNMMKGKGGMMDKMKAMPEMKH